MKGLKQAAKKMQKRVGDSKTAFGASNDSFASRKRVDRKLEATGGVDGSEVAERLDLFGDGRDDGELDMDLDIIGEDNEVEFF